MEPQNLSSAAVVAATGEDYPAAADSDYFDDSEYGLLNVALVVQQNPDFTWNSSEGIKQT